MVANRLFAADLGNHGTGLRMMKLLEYRAKLELDSMSQEERTALLASSVDKAWGSQRRAQQSQPTPSEVLASCHSHGCLASKIQEMPTPACKQVNVFHKLPEEGRRRYFERLDEKDGHQISGAGHRHVLLFHSLCGTW